MASVSANVKRNLEGWGRSSWSSGAWNRAITGTLDVSGSIGSIEAVTPDAVVDVTGLSTTGAVGTVVIPTVNTEVDGIEINANVGSVEILLPDVTLFVTGVGSTGSIGTTTMWGLVDTSQTPNWEEIKEAA
jgi:hypothetical protein